jgi:hypothetical protein
MSIAQCPISLFKKKKRKKRKMRENKKVTKIYTQVIRHWKSEDEVHA